MRFAQHGGQLDDGRRGVGGEPRRGREVHPGSVSAGLVLALLQHRCDTLLQETFLGAS